MTPLEEAIERHVPALLRHDARGTVGFAATSGPERGFWIVDLAARSARRGTDEDRPDVVVEGDAAALLLLFTGGLDPARAIEAGVLLVRGDRAVLDGLAAASRSG